MKQFIPVIQLAAALLALSVNPLAIVAQEATPETSPETPALVETATPTPESTEAVIETPTEAASERAADSTPEATSEPTTEVTLEPTEEATAEATPEASAEPTEEATVEPTETLPPAPPVFDLAQMTFETVPGQMLEISFNVADEMGVVRIDADTSTILGNLGVVTTEPVETNAPFNTPVTLTYLAPADFSGDDSFTLTAIDAMGETASVTLVITVQAEATPEVTPEATAESLVISEDGVMVVTTYVVNDNGDAVDANIGDEICDTDLVTPDNQCSLRAAIQESNFSTGDRDTIEFSIGTGTVTIQPTTPLPFITDPVIIDATTQPGYSGTPIVVLNGANVERLDPAEDEVGLNIWAGDTDVRGLVVNGFFYAGIGMVFEGGNVLENTYVGTDASGNAAVPNRYGIAIAFQSNNNTIGGGTASTRNVISGNTDDGVNIYDSSGNTVQGNYIGVGANGTTDLGNGDDGVKLEETTDNLIGGTIAGARNIISGNTNNGVIILDGSGTSIVTSSNTIQGNFIGTNAAGMIAVSNGLHGVFVENASGNMIGGTAAGAGNVISGNTNDGIRVESGTGNLVQSNFVGTNIAGTSAIPNQAAGVRILNASNNTIGGVTASARNLISGNTTHGVIIQSASATGNAVQGNYVGTDLSGAVALGNNFGVSIDNASGNTVGGTSPNVGNLVSGNTFAGVYILGAGASNNLVQGNTIGANATRTLALGNPVGVLIENASNNTIGGMNDGEENLIAFNTGDGIAVTGATAIDNSLLSNYIFANGGLGIDLGDDGVTANDSPDTDTGPNNLQNYPVLTIAYTADGTTLTVNGTLNSAASTTFRVEFFANATCDASGNGEGQFLLGFADVTTDGSGNATINIVLDIDVALGEQITATATDPNGNTSEFSACAEVVIDPNILVVNTLNTVVDGNGCDATHCSLVEAVNASNSMAGDQTINFDIPGSDTLTINLPNTLVLDESVIIDGRTQPGYDDFSAAIELRPLDNSVPNAFHLRGGGDPYNPGFSASIYGVGMNQFSSYALNITNGTDHRIEENYMGVDPITLNGVLGLQAGILLNTPNNLIINNFIALANGNGISLEADAADNNIISGNLIVANNTGIAISGGASNTLIQANMVSGNDLDGIYIAGPSTGNIMRGNFIGTNTVGLIAFSNDRYGIYINDSDGNIIGGTTGVTPGGSCSGQCNVISGNATGVYIQQSDSTQIISNFIGTTVIGTQGIANTQAGIHLIESNNTIIGGVTAPTRNLISGNNDGIRIEDSDGTQIQGNYIGFHRDGVTALANIGLGVLVISGDNNLIGGTAAGTANRIGFNGQDGVRVSNGTGNSVLGNEIRNNGRLGIDLALGVSAVSPNDPGDEDTGPNDGQNFPVLNLALNNAGTLEIDGSLNSLPNATYRVEFFANAACDSSKNGEGQTFLGFSDVTTDSTGNSIIDIAFPMPTGQIITATATDANGSTSEFSACRTISLTLPVTAAPVLIAPAKSSFTNDNTPPFSWNTVLNALDYEIQVSSTNNFAALEFNVTSPATVQTPTTPLAEGIHYWRVRGINVLGSGPWSATFSFTVDTVAPNDAPGLIRPADGSPTTDTTPVFAWQRYTGAKRYQLRLSTNPDCINDLILTSPILTRTSFVVPTADALTMEDTYFWCVRADDPAGNWGPYSDASSFQLTLLKAPLNGSSTTDPTPTFSWNKALGTGITYDLVVSVNPDLSDPVIDVNGLTTTRFTPITLLDTGRTYYWRVVVNGGTWQVADQVVWAFLLNPAKLVAPTITAPANRSFTFDVSPEVAWTLVTDITGVTITYEMQVDDDARFGSPFKVNGLFNSPYTIAPDLPGTPGTRYSVRVRAVYDGVVYGPWSKVISFTLDTVNPDVPELISPLDGAALTNLRPPFRWKTVKGAAQYQLQLSTDDTFTNPLSIFVRGGAYTPPAPLLPVTYWWRVQALDAAGNESGWGLIYDMTLISPASAAPMPNRSATATPTFTWLPIFWALGYELQIALDSSFKFLVYSNNSIDAVDTSLTLTEDLPNGVYYWRIRARQTATIWGKWSSTGLFTIES